MSSEVERELAEARRELSKCETQFTLWSQARVDAEERYAAALERYVWARRRSGDSPARAAGIEVAS